MSRAGGTHPGYTIYKNLVDVVVLLILTLTSPQLCKASCYVSQIVQHCRFTSTLKESDDGVLQTDVADNLTFRAV